MTGKQFNMSVNPDEVVADGAAVQGGVLTATFRHPASGRYLPFGVETMGGVMTKMIDRNTTIPTSKTEITHGCRTSASVEINVLQGEREMAADNRRSVRFNLTGIPAARRGTLRLRLLRHRRQRHREGTAKR